METLQRSNQQYFDKAKIYVCFVTLEKFICRLKDNVKSKVNLQFHNIMEYCVFLLVFVG